MSRAVSYGMASEQAADAQASSAIVLFSSVPAFTGREAVLFDTARPADAAEMPADAVYSRLLVRALERLDPRSVDSSVELLVYAGDLAVPAIRVRLVDLLRQGGERPVQIARRAGAPVRVVLLDPKGVWAKRAPRLEVSLE